MKSIALSSYAKINLSIDVIGKLPNGYHQVEMVMQQIALHDDIAVKWMPGEQWSIELGCNKPYLPTDERNLAYQAAQTMAQRFGMGKTGKIRIDMKKKIPVGAGLAGGSSNCAAVLHGLSHLWGLSLTVGQLCEIGAPLGSDVPFCIMAQAKANHRLGERMNKDPLATDCALARGTGTDLMPISGLHSHILLSKPSISVSTAEVYKGLSLDEIVVRPDTQELIEGLKEKNYDKIKKNMVNVLEIVTLKRYPVIMYTKNMMLEADGALAVMMSGSGPTIFGVFSNKAKGQVACQALLSHNKETFLTHTTR